MNSIVKFIFLSIAIISFFSCSKEEIFLPKPKGYHHIDLPATEYVSLKGDYPYTFEHSKHAKVIPDTSFMAEPYWIELYYPELTAEINIAYKPVKNNVDSLAKYFNGSFKLTHKHEVKATAINEIITSTDKGYLALLFEIEGDVPSQFQFFVTDSTNHFLRAALYFPTSTKNDSLAPVIDYVKKDMIKMINTIDWKEK